MTDVSENAPAQPPTSSTPAEQTTSTIQVPSPDASKTIVFRSSDMRVDKYTHGALTQYYMKMTHVPTNISVEARAFSRGKLRRILGEKLFGAFKNEGYTVTEAKDNGVYQGG
jgi:hypothetical protein